jgi:hypothetical protein
VEIGRAHAGLIEIAVAADVVLHRVDLSFGTQTRVSCVVVGLRHLEAKRSRVPGDGTAKHVTAPITQRGGDPEQIVVGPTFLRDHLNDVRLTTRQRPCLVEGQHAQPANLLQELAPFDQHAMPGC